MTNKIFTSDRFKLTTRKTLPNGSIKAKVVLARSGIFEYLGREIGLSGKDADKVFRVYRPKDALFNKETIDSFKLVPFTIEHPPEMLTPDNIKEYQEGVMGENIRQESEDLLVGDVVIATSDGIDALEKMKEVSIGFYAFYEYKNGTAENGETYDAIQIALEGNHVALVPAGRCGQKCNVFDNSTPGDNTMGTKVIKIAGVDCKVEDTLAPIIEQALKTADSKVDSLKEEVEKLTTTVSEQEATIDSMKKEVEDAKKAASPSVILKAAEERVELLTRVKAIDASIECSGKDSTTLMREALEALDSDIKFEGNKASDAYIQARFDIESEKLSKKSSVDEDLRKGSSHAGTKSNSIDKAREKFVKGGDEQFIGNTLGA